MAQLLFLENDYLANSTKLTKILEDFFRFLKYLKKKKRLNPGNLPLAALYPLPCFIGLRSLNSLSISDLSSHLGRYTHAYGIHALFYCLIHLKEIYGGGGIGLSQVFKRIKLHKKDLEIYIYFVYLKKLSRF